MKLQPARKKYFPKLTHRFRMIGIYRRNFMFNLNKINSKLLLFTGLLIFLYFSAPEKINAFPNFDYDGKADFSVFRPSDRTWYAYSTESETSSGFQWGLSTDVLVPADYDGDGQTDIAVWRPSNGTWYVHRSRDNQLFAIQWGSVPVISPSGSISLVSPDVPVPADYDGDGLADFAVWRPDSGIWYVLQSTDGYNPRYAKYYQWGKLGDVPVPADYDGDGKTDLAVFRGSSQGLPENRWYILQSSNNQWRSVSFGRRGDDLLVPADYDGDRKADIAVYRSGIWYILRSTDNQVEARQFGMAGDKPVPADYDGDGKTDLAVYRKGVWYILESSTGRFRASLNAKESIVAVP
jgi:hypothetical protein